MSEHKGLSGRTGELLSRLKQSAIRDHAMTWGSDVPLDAFKSFLATAK